MLFVSVLRAFVLILFSTFCLFAQADQVEDKLRDSMKRKGIPGLAVEYYSQGKVKSYYLGYADKSKKKPVTQDTIFEIASVTKIFTAVLLAEELLAGSMHLDDPVTEYVKDLPASTKNKLNQMTLKDLATHTSGLPFNVPKNINSRKKLNSFFVRWKNPAPVGTRWLYSNINMGLLGFSLENQSHKSIYELYEERILRPLGMLSSGGMIPPHLEPNYAQGYNMSGAPAPRRNKKEWISPPNSDWIFPATGALKASAKDMRAFLKACLRIPGTPEKINEAMKLSQTTFMITTRFNQGLAWIIHPDPSEHRYALLHAPVKPGPHKAHPSSKGPFYDGDALMEKTGASGGFRAYIGIIPNEQKGVVLLVNRYISSSDLVHMGREILLNQ